MLYLIRESLVLVSLQDLGDHDLNPQSSNIRNLHAKIQPQ